MTVGSKDDYVNLMASKICIRDHVKGLKGGVQHTHTLKRTSFFKLDI